MNEQYEIGYIEVLAGNPVAMGFVVGFIILTAIIIFLRYRPKDLSAKVEDKKEVVVQPETEKQPEGILGIGSYKCMAFRQGNIVDFTTIPEPIGEVYFFDPTCPISGAGYIVRENENGKIVDYDPREVQVVIERTPEYAWHAMNWTDDVFGFWIVPLSWWKTPATWFAIALIMMVFVSTLVVLE